MPYSFLRFLHFLCIGSWPLFLMASFLIFLTMFLYSNRCNISPHEMLPLPPARWGHRSIESPPWEKNLPAGFFKIPGAGRFTGSFALGIDWVAPRRHLWIPGQMLPNARILRGILQGIRQGVELSQSTRAADDGAPGALAGLHFKVTRDSPRIFSNLLDSFSRLHLSGGREGGKEGE